jgi:hypothetical protein
VRVEKEVKEKKGWKKMKKKVENKYYRRSVRRTKV